MTDDQTIASALRLHRAKHYKEADALYRQILAADPENADALHLLGVLHYELRQYPAAIASIRQALASRPDFPHAQMSLAIVLQATGQLDEAIQTLQLARSLHPNIPAIHTNLGAAFQSTGQLDPAIASFRLALKLDPNIPEALCGLSAALYSRHQFDESLKCAEQALALRPNYAQAHSNLGNALKVKRKLAEALAAHRRAVALRPDLAEIHANLGVTLVEIGLFPKAIAAYHQALLLKPHFPQACNYLAIALARNGQLDDAIAAHRQAIALNPTDAAAHSNLLFSLHFHPAYTPPKIAAELADWNHRHAEPLHSLIPKHQNDPTPDRPLNIAYISPDFRDHVLILFMLPLFRHHDHKNFRLHCYSDVAAPGPLTEQVKQTAGVWRDILGHSDADVAHQIQQDKIDILIDLTMHMGDNRQLLLARKPAPVQVAWLAYPGSTGQQSIDYRLTDPYLDPPEMFDAFYSEKSIRLPDTFWCYEPLPGEAKSLTPNPLPALKNDYITFGSFNNFFKLSDISLDLWAPTLAALPTSKLLLMAPPGETRTTLLQKLESRGIALERVELIGPQTRAKYLELYHRIDIALDTIPYNGHTTSLDSFWMGVPVVTLIGSTVVGRAGFCQLSNLNLQNLAAQSPAEFTQIATTLAADLPRLVDLRANLRERMQHSPLMDAPRFAANIESAYRQMWRTWCQSRARQP